MTLTGVVSSVVLIGAILCFGVADGLGDPTDDFLDELEIMNEEYIDAFRAGDVERVAGFYTDDAVVHIPLIPALEGRREIEDWLEMVYDIGVKHMIVKVTEAQATEDIAYEIGRYSALDKNGALKGRGHYVALWKRQNGQWKIFRSMSTG